MVAPLGRRNSCSTRACFEFARLLGSPLRAVFGLTLDEACAFATRPRLRLDMPKLLSLAPAQNRAALAGERSKPIRLAVRGHTHALFGLKLQRKVSMACWIGRRRLISGSGRNRGNSCHLSDAGR